MQLSALDALVQQPTRALASVRRGRAFHRNGVTRIGAAIIDTVDLPLTSGPVTVRVSKGLGTPKNLPDLIGVAVRFGPQNVFDTANDRQWDLLMAGPVQRFAGLPVVVPAYRWSGADVSPLTPFDYRGERWRLAGRLVTPPTAHGLDIDGLAAALRSGNAILTLTASRDGGPWQTVGRVEFGDVQARGDIAFDPAGSVPAGVHAVPSWLGPIRRAAYSGSRRGRQ